MKRSIFALVFALAGCASQAEVKYVPQVKTVRIEPPAECLSADQPWTNLPDADATRSAVSQNYATNRRAHNAVLADRAVCRAGLKAQKKG